MEKSLWTYEGRISLGVYWLRFLIWCVVTYLGGFVIRSIFGPSGTGMAYDTPTNYTTMALTNVWSVLTIAFILIQGAKRMHDIDKSGWYQLIPIYSWVLLLTPGTIGPNRFGLNPKEAKKSQQSNK